MYTPFSLCPAFAFLLYTALLFYSFLYYHSFSISLSLSPFLYCPLSPFPHTISLPSFLLPSLSLPFSPPCIYVQSNVQWERNEDTLVIYQNLTCRSRSQVVAACCVISSVWSPSLVFTVLSFFVYFLDTLLVLYLC